MKKIVVNSESRDINLDVYNNFKHFQTTLFGNKNYSPSTDSYENIKYQSFTYKNYLPFDPVSLLYPNPNNLSWKILNNLESILPDTDLIGITDTYYFWNYQLTQYAIRKNIPLYTVIWCNIPNHISTWLPPYSMITKKVIDNTSLFILRNNRAYQFTDKLRIPREKTVLIYPGVNLSKFTLTTEKNSEKINILYVGALTVAKGIPLLMKVFTKLSSKYKNIELHIAGTGPLEKVLKQQSTTLPIKMHGYIPYSQLPELYKNADIFCSPSETHTVAGIKIWHEYFSYTLLEAQAAGLPIVTTASGGIPEEISSENFLIPEQNDYELEKSLIALIENPHLRVELGKINRSRAENLFDLKIQSEKLENELLKITYA